MEPCGSVSLAESTASRYEAQNSRLYEALTISTSTAVADSKGWYSISLHVGHYILHAFVDAGPSELYVVANQKELTDYEVWHLPQ